MNNDTHHMMMKMMNKIILCLILLISTNVFSQTSVGVCIVKDTNMFFVIKDTIKIGYDMKKTLIVEGTPIEKIKCVNSKEKWVYVDKYIYFNDDKISIIVNRKKYE